MTISYNNIIETFQQFVDNHFFLKTFSHGSPEDVDQEKNTEMPLLHVIYTGATYPEGSNLKVFGLEIVILDNPLDKEAKVPFQKEVISDCEKCAEDILSDITNGFNIFTWAKGTTVLSAQTQVLEEETKNTLAGVQLSIAIQTPFVYDACDLPLTPVIAPPSGDCLPATYINSNVSFTIEIPAGSTYTSSDITVTDVDSTTRNVPSNNNVTCAWTTIRINGSTGNGLLNITSFPAGSIATLPDQSVDPTNSGGTKLELGVTYLNNGILNLSDATVEDSAGSTTTDAICSNILLPNTTVNSVSVVGNLMTINTPTAATPSGICYQNPVPLFNQSFTTGDSWSNYLAGRYDRTAPTYPEAFAEVDYSATQADVRGTPASGTSSTDNVAPTMLKENNAFNNKFRYTDDAGNPSDATVGSNLWAHVDWNNHSWTDATTGYVIDHLTGYGYSQSYLLDGVKYNMTTADGQSWSAWVSYIDGIGAYLGYTGWMIIDGSELNGAHGAKAMPQMVWADNFFNFQRSDNRGSFLTGENCTSTKYYNINDSGNDDMMLDISKATSTGFSDVITNVFIKRKHY